MILRGFMGNWPYKLLALAAAIVLAAYVHSERNPRTTASIDAEIMALNNKQGHTVRLSPAKVSIALQGPKSEVDALIGIIRSGDIKPTVDVAQLKPGNYKIPIVFVVPNALAPSVNAQPVVRKADVSIESTSNRKMSVQVKVKTSPPLGSAVGPIRIDPPTASIKGPSSVVESVTALQVVCDPTPLKPSVDELAPIKAVDARGRQVKGVEINPEEAHVILKLVEAPASKAVFVQPNVTGQPQYPYRVTKISVVPNSVTLKGKPEVLAGTTVLATDVVDISDTNTDTIRRVGLHLPPGVQIEGAASVRVFVRVAPGTGQQ